MSSMHFSMPKWPLTLGLAIVLMAPLAKAEVAEALSRGALPTEHGSRSFLLGLAQTKERVIAVGERGLLLLSADEGRSWRQVPVPVSVTLTAVEFANEKVGFAIGHGGSVLATTDGGETWSLRLDGRRIAEKALSVANASGDEHLIASAQRLASDGPDKPLLDLLVLDDKRVIVVGAYGLILLTDDGGHTWTSLFDKIENIFGSHIYVIRQSENRILMAGEMGAVWLSQDSGNSFDVLETPYEGSFFTAELMGAEEIVLAGLRGNAWRSNDNGDSWKQIATNIPATINASTLRKNGELLVVNQAGMIMRKNGDSLVPVTSKPLPPLNDLLELHNGDFLLLSRRGVLSLASGDLQ